MPAPGSSCRRTLPPSARRSRRSAPIGCRSRPAIAILSRDHSVSNPVRSVHGRCRGSERPTNARRSVVAEVEEQRGQVVVHADQPVDGDRFVGLPGGFGQVCARLSSDNAQHKAGCHLLSVRLNVTLAGFTLIIGTTCAGTGTYTGHACDTPRFLHRRFRTTRCGATVAEVVVVVVGVAGIAAGSTGSNVGTRVALGLRVAVVVVGRRGAAVVVCAGADAVVGAGVVVWLAFIVGAGVVALLAFIVGACVVGDAVELRAVGAGVVAGAVVAGVEVAGVAVVGVGVVVAGAGGVVGVDVVVRGAVVAGP